MQPPKITFEIFAQNVASSTLSKFSYNAALEPENSARKLSFFSLLTNPQQFTWRHPTYFISQSFYLASSASLPEGREGTRNFHKSKLSVSPFDNNKCKAITCSCTPLASLSLSLSPS